MMNSPKAFSYYFYGLECVVESTSSLFFQLLKQKFSGYNKMATANLCRGEVKVEFFQELPPHMSGTTIANGVVVSANEIVIVHRYLGTTTTIAISFTNDNLSKIKLHYKQTPMFSLLSGIMGDVLRKQLFQQLIKLYIEQTLLWFLTKQKRLRCVHAAAVEKDGEVLIFAGLNGVGKSTLAQLLIQQEGYSFFADNYVLIDHDYAYFAPDIVRLDKKSLSLLQKQDTGYFGFNKYILSQTKPSRHLKAKLTTFFFVSQGSEWKRTKTISTNFWNKLELLQTIHGENVSFAPVAQQYPLGQALSIIPSGNVSYYDLTISKQTPFKAAYL